MDAQQVVDVIKQAPQEIGFVLWILAAAVIFIIAVLAGLLWILGRAGVLKKNGNGGSSDGHQPVVVDENKLGNAISRVEDAVTSMRSELNARVDQLHVRINEAFGELGELKSDISAVTGFIGGLQHGSLTLREPWDEDRRESYKRDAKAGDYKRGTWSDKHLGKKP